MEDRDIAMFSSGRLPVRAEDVASGLPTIGDGNHEWSGFEPLARHARGANPRSGVILNWNNKPAGGFSASDDNWSYGPVPRVQLLAAQVAKRPKHTLASLVGAMEHWREWGASRLDDDLDGKIDDPGAAIMDAAWPRIADAVMRPTLGPLTDRLKRLIPVDDPANPGGSAYYNGWYSYVVKDLTGERPTFCGGGDPQACRASLWAAIAATGSQLKAEHGPDANAWRADATGERLRFGFLPKTARWTNRPTFQQVITFAGHRRR